MSAAINSILAVTAISLLSLIGVFALSLTEDALDNFLFVLLSFSAGSILGAALLELLPEAIELVEESFVFVYVAIGYVGFFILERFVYWYHGHIHGHESKSEVDERLAVKDFVYLNLIGDAIHNFLDGIAIGASFLISVPVGISTTVAVVFHELPQEIGDFGVLVYGGFSRGRALMFNFLSALTAILGVIVSNYLLKDLTGFLIAFTAGGFVYIAASELIPEIQKEENFGKSVVQLILFILGIALIWSLGIVFPE
ncbi:MAG: ZIP family metal transporter [Candidatus Bathyarchaeota archaeon]|nr:MAG: ZIP family metal transporter [Candidatus Bathyarchaeota archaeon]